MYVLIFDFWFQIPNGRSFLAGIVHDGNIYIFGGNGDQNTRSNELYKFKVDIISICTQNSQNQLLIFV